MRPSDPWLRQQLAPAWRQLLAVVASGVLACAFVIAQAWAITGLVLAVLHHDDLTRPAVFLAATLVARALAGFVGDVAASRAAARVGTVLRRRLVAALVDRDLAGATGEVSVLTTRGVSAAEPYVTRYLPALVLAAVLPPATVAVIATQDLLSAFIVLATLPLVPVFGALVGLATRDRAREQWHEMSSLSGHFLDVVRGLPTLVAHRRARAQSGRIAAITDRYRLASLRTLRIAFASSLVLELVATLSVALVAVTAGVRLAQGSLPLHTALVVLLLAPEAYWPLRRVGAEFHAAAEGVATFEAVRDLLDGTPSAADRDAGGAAEPGAPAGAPRRDRHPPRSHRPGRRRPRRRHPRARGHRGHRPQRLREVHPARRARRSAAPRGRHRHRRRPPGGRTGLAGAGRLAAAATALRRRHPGRQPAARPSRRVGYGPLGRPARGRPRGAGPRPPGRPRDGARRGRHHALGRRARRLALARVVVADRPWMLLDEPTAHLDDLTERVITDTLVELGRRGAVVVVAHRPAVVAAADHHLELPTPRSHERTSAPVRPARTTTSPVPAEDVDLPPASFGVSTLLSGIASASGVALTATAGWLIVQASTHPAVLTMLVAIVGVRAFGIGRPAVRYAERLRSHDAALRLLARRRVQVYDAIVPLTPGRLGRRRGDLLTAVVDDVDSVVDRELRVRMPWRSYVVVAALASAVALLVHPASAPVVAVGAAASGAGAYWLARLGAARSEEVAVTARAALSARVVEVAQVARELRMWQATDRCVDEAARLSDRQGDAVARAGAWAAAGRVWVLAVTAGGVTAVAAVTAPAVASGALSGPMMALLVLMPLALADVAVPLADAGALSVRTDAAADRLARLERTALAVRDTVARPAGTRHDVLVDDARGQWDPDAPPTAPCTLALEPGDRVAIVGASGSGKSTLAALLVRFLDPVSGVVRHGGVDLRDLALDEVRRLTGFVDDDPYIFATTLAENVRLARPGATDDQVAEALAQARLGDWVAGLPDGLDTWLGDGHAGLGGRARPAGRGPLTPGRPARAGARRAGCPPRPRHGRASRRRAADG